MNNNDPKLITDEEGNIVYEDSPWTNKPTVINPIKPSKRSLGNSIDSILIVGERGNPNIIKKLPPGQLLGVSLEGDWAGFNIDYLGEDIEQLRQDLQNLFNSTVSNNTFSNFQSSTLTSFSQVWSTINNNLVSQLDFNAAIDNLVTQTHFNTTVNQLVTQTDFDSAIGNLVTRTDFNSAIGDLVTQTDFNSAIGDLVTQTDFDTVIDSLVTQTNFDTIISDLNSAIGNKVSQTDFDSTVNNLVTQTNFDDTISSMVSQLEFNNTVDALVSLSQFDAAIGDLVTQTDFDAAIGDLVTQTDFDTVVNTLVTTNTVSQLESSINALEQKTPTLLINGLTESGQTINKRFSTLQFDNDSGFNLEDSGETAIVSLGSHFKTLTVNGSDVVAEGQDTLSLDFGEGIDVNTTNVENDKSISISLSNLSGVSNIFLIDIQPINNNDNTQNNLAADELSIESFSTNTTDVQITIEFDGGQDSYRGFYTVNGMDFDSYTKITSRTFRAFKTITLSQTLEGSLTISGNGSQIEIPYNKLISGQILSSKINGIVNSEVGQTDIKGGDQIELSIEANTKFKEVVVESGDFIQEVIDVSLLSQNTVVLTVNNNTSINKLSDAVIRIRDENDSLSDPFTVTNSLNIDNGYPSLLINAINSNTALKDGDTINVGFSVQDQDSLQFVSNELNEVNRTSSDITLELSSGGVALGYRDSGNNIELRAIKISNASITSKTGLVKIANDPPSLSAISGNIFRSQEGQSVIRTTNLNFNQELSSLTVSNTLQEGNLISVNGANKNWSIEIEVTSNMIHKENPYPISFEPVNLASVQQTVTSQYFIKGFQEVIRTIDTNTTLQTSVEAEIVDPSKLIVISNNPPLTYKVVDALQGNPDEIVVSGSSTITFDSAITSFLTGNDPIGSLTVTIKEVI